MSAAKAVDVVMTPISMQHTSNVFTRGRYASLPSPGSLAVLADAPHYVAFTNVRARSSWCCSAAWVCPLLLVKTGSDFHLSFSDPFSVITDTALRLSRPKYTLSLQLK